ncbi:MAG TPA: ankyrin repeat domain-containing protein [Thermoanaerobaculia bacterium]|nr:ankyrin repeat domain-containing protein [Thermoanaerobaculia bacterium]
MTELFDAIRSGDAAAVHSLLDSDPGLLAGRQNNVSAVMWAIYNGRKEIARLLVQRGADVSFHEACALGDAERVAAMLEADASLLDAKSPDGFPGVGLAIFFGHPGIARLLIERGADVAMPADNAQRVAPVHAAAAACDRETMLLLLERGADPNARQQMDYTALHGAASRGDVEMAKMLIDRGADRAARGSDGKTVAEVAVEHGHPEFAAWLSAN